MSEIEDKRFMRGVIDEAEDYIASDGEPEPFAACIVRNGQIIASAFGGSRDPGGHPEIECVRKAVDELDTLDLRDCTLYTNVEPCAACAYVIRDFNVGRVVWSVSSPHCGGESRWGILQAYIPCIAAATEPLRPELCAGVLEHEGRVIFDRLGWKMHKND